MTLSCCWCRMRSPRPWIHGRAGFRQAWCPCLPITKLTWARLRVGLSPFIDAPLAEPMPLGRSWVLVSFWLLESENPPPWWLKRMHRVCRTFKTWQTIPHSKDMYVRPWTKPQWWANCVSASSRSSLSKLTTWQGCFLFESPKSHRWTCLTLSTGRYFL